jgi:hypothetical protein
MKNNLFIVLLVLFALFGLNQSFELYTASTSPDSTSSILSGSVRGGTKIYIKGLGFSPHASDNKIFLGNYPCPIPADGATEMVLVCETVNCGRENDIYNLEIIVYSNGLQVSFGP